MTRRKYTKEVLETAVRASNSHAGVLRFLGLAQAGGTQSLVARRIKEYGIDTTHFLGKSYLKGQPSPNRKSAEDILVILPEGSYRPKRSQIKRALVERGVPESCAACALGVEWNGSPLNLEIDHIDGDWLNNLVENLRFLCPNCHSQQVTSNKPWKNRTK